MCSGNVKVECKKAQPKELMMPQATTARGNLQLMLAATPTFCFARYSVALCSPHSVMPTFAETILLWEVSVKVADANHETETSPGSCWLSHNLGCKKVVKSC